MWIDDDVALSALIDQAVESDRYALDTEFHREKTYYPKLALLQIRVGEVTALVDPLAINTQMLGRLFAADSLCIIHAAQQDLEVLQHASGSVPKRIFDTQLSSGFIGMSTPSLASLVQNELKISLPKGDRLTDWLRRPLTADQQKYAASDVDYLFVLHDSIMARLNELGRASWAAEACEELRSRPSGPQDPSEAWLRIKEVRTFGLDRIDNVEVLKQKFKKDKGIKPLDMFDNIIGVNGEDGKVEEVHLSLTPLQGKYLKSLPLHKSQLVIKEDEKETVISLKVVVNYELMQRVLMLGEYCKVLQPKSLIDSVKKSLKESLGNY